MHQNEVNLIGTPHILVYEDMALQLGPKYIEALQIQRLRQYNELVKQDAS